MYRAYVPNKTVSLPDDVVPIIDSLGMPFSQWVAQQLRHHDEERRCRLMRQELLADAELAGESAPDRGDMHRRLERMNRSAPW